MSTDSTDLVRRVRLKLLWSLRPVDKFYGSLCMRLRDVISEAVPTAATDGRVILWNPKFLAENMQYATGIMAHEIWHCALCHHTRRAGRDPELWNIAGDLAINHALKTDGFTLPPNSLMPGEKPFADMKPGLSADEYYRRLVEKQRKEGEEGGNGKPVAGEVRDHGSLSKDGGPGKGKENKDGKAKDGDGGIAKSEADWRRAVAIAKDAVRSANMGKLPAGVALLLGDVLEVKVPWEEQIIAQVSCRTREESDWTRPNRRMACYGIFQPSKTGLRLGHVVMHWDTSGSCLDELGRWAGALVSLFRQYQPQRISLLWGDTHIEGGQEYDQNQPFDESCIKHLRPQGGGGTSHIPLFKHIEQEQWEPDVLVCLTDLYTQLPPVPPNYPVLWVTTANKQAPFGSVIEIR